MDPAFVHELIYEALFKMDELRMDPLSFMEKRWTTFFITFDKKYGENVKPISSYPKGSATDDDGEIFRNSWC